MNIFGFLKRKAALVPVRSSFWGVIREPFTGAWQRNVTCDSVENLCAFSAVYSCISLIAGDIAKLRLKLTELTPSGIWREVVNSPLSPVLRKPNRYQTRIQFISHWLSSKLVHGNAYVLKERDDRNVVVALYVLDPRLVVPLVADDGSVYYQINRDNLAGVQDPITIPASEMIHDRMLCLWHPLVGVAPLSACGASATQGIRIQANSAQFFQNMSRPSGQLTAPGTISDETAERLKKTFEEKFGAGNIGRLFVAGDGLKYEAMTIPAQDAQLIEQLRWTVEDVARCFHVPLHKLGMGQPTLNNIAALNQDYYSQCLQLLIEDIEALLDEGLGLTNIIGKTYGVEADLDGLLRMDPLTQADVQEKGARAGTFSPDENRKKWNLEPVKGGESPMIQQQNWQLAQLADRVPPNDAPALPPPTAPEDGAVKAFIDRVRSGFVDA